MFLEANSLEEIKRELDKLYMVTILHGINLDFDYIREQILTRQEVSSIESLTHPLCVPTFKCRNPHVEASAMVSTREREGRGNKEGRGGRGRLQCSYYKIMDHTQNNCYSLYGFPNKIDL